MTQNSISALCSQDLEIEAADIWSRTMAELDEPYSPLDIFDVTAEFRD